jgi:hypothetical protein
MAKYQVYFQQMLSLNKEAFDKFKDIHDKFSVDPKKYQSEFNNIGRDIQDLIREWEDKLCSHSEGSGYGKFSSTLSDKFWAEIRKNFPKIDYIGLL